MGSMVRKRIPDALGVLATIAILVLGGLNVSAVEQWKDSNAGFEAGAPVNFTLYYSDRPFT